jgi:6-phosphogluconolactonase (cycloisomerase 2 family)
MEDPTDDRPMAASRFLAIIGLVLGSPFSGTAQEAGAVFVMTNDAVANEIVVFDRGEDGRLTQGSAVATGGRGTGGEIDPLQSQGSLILSEDGAWLFAVNAGSREISQFAVDGTEIELVARVPSRGSTPISLTVFDDLLYVLNAGGRPSIQGFRVEEEGTLRRINASKRFLLSDVSSRGRAEGPAQIGFSSDGSQLVVTDRITDEIHLFAIDADGRPAEDSVRWPSFGEGPFGFDFDRRGFLLVSEVWGRNPAGTVLEGAVSSYAILSGGSLETVAGSVENFEAATCWLVSAGRKSAFVTNTTSGSVSRYRVRPNGRLKLRGGGHRFGGSPDAFPTDMAITPDGEFLYTLNAGRGTIGVFRVRNSGKLVFLGEGGSLPALAGLQGIAAH